MMHIATAFKVFAAMAIGLPAPGQANPAIDQDTKCQVVVDDLNNKDSPHAQEAYRVAKQLMAEFDKAAAAHGKAGVIEPLTAQRAEDVYILVLETCRAYPQQTLGKTAADTYDGLRDLRDRASTH